VGLAFFILFSAWLGPQDGKDGIDDLREVAPADDIDDMFAD